MGPSPGDSAFHSPAEDGPEQIRNPDRLPRRKHAGVAAAGIGEPAITGVPKSAELG